MAFLGTILQELVKIKKVRRERKVKYTADLQDKTLVKLLKKASVTKFGKHYDFASILASPDPKKAFAEKLPVFTYNKLHDEWWHRSLRDEPNVTWPGKIKYYALTSGTSGSPSKRVPVTNDMIIAMRHSSIRQMLSMYDLKMPVEFYQKQMCMLGGSAKLNKVYSHYEGDLSGILATKVPRWFYRFRKPSKPVASIKDWETKLNVIAERAPRWDIGILAGNPAWVQIMLQRVIERHKLNNIHEIWPNLHILVHGGVAFGPYKQSIAALMGREIHYLDTYLASEGFFAFENAFANGAMQLVLDKGIYFEFVPFNEDNFTAEGEIKPDAQTISVHEVQEGVNYALMISTCAGVWRYLIGDTVKFTNVEKFEIAISGRTKHFISLCGEHLSVDNMNRAVELVAKEFNIAINEFTASGIPYEGMFGHHWFLGVNEQVDKVKLRERLDYHLCQLNDDYAVERRHALKEVLVDTVPLQLFYDYMAIKWKVGGQAKFPRVLSKAQYAEWVEYTKSVKVA